MFLKIWFIKNVFKACFFIAIDVIVFFICSVSDFIESLEWPVIQTFYGIFKAVVKIFFQVDAAYTPVPNFPGRHNCVSLARGNDFVEDLLRIINDKLLEKSFILEDKVAGVQSIGIIPVTVELRLCSNVRMDYRLMRAGNCFLNEDGRRSGVYASIKGCEFYLESDIQMKVGPFTKTFHVTGNIPYMEAFVEFHFNNETSAEGKLAEFIIIDILGTNFKFVGAGPLNIIVNFTGKKLLKVFKRRFITTLQDIALSQIAILLKTFKFPATRPFHSLECSPRSERLQAISEESEHSSQSESQPSGSESSDHSPSKEQPAIPEAVDRSPPTEQQPAIPEAVDRSLPTEQQPAIPEAVDRSLPSEQQGQRLDGENSSSYPEQQKQVTVAEGSDFTNQDSSPQLSSRIPFIRIEDYSQSSDNEVETKCSLETQ